MTVVANISVHIVFMKKISNTCYTQQTKDSIAHVVIVIFVKQLSWGMCIIKTPIPILVHRQRKILIRKTLKTKSHLTEERMLAS